VGGDIKLFIIVINLKELDPENDHSLLEAPINLSLLLSYIIAITAYLSRFVHGGFGRHLGQVTSLPTVDI
jgi:hypothetical protein